MPSIIGLITAYGPNKKKYGRIINLLGTINRARMILAVNTRSEARGLYIREIRYIVAPQTAIIVISIAGTKDANQSKITFRARMIPDTASLIVPYEFIMIYAYIQSQHISVQQ
jgi:hypothetical protein